MIAIVNKINCVIGCDPGSNGGIACWRHGEKTATIKMPKDLNDFRDYLNYIKDNYSPIVFIEKLSVRPDDIAVEGGHANMGKLFRIQKMIANFEQLKATVAACDIPYALVHPMKWQNTLKLRIKTKGSAVETKTQRKARYKDIAGQLYPEITPTLWNADATLIMHFGRYVLKNDLKWLRQNIPGGLNERLF